MAIEGGQGTIGVVNVEIGGNATGLYTVLGQAEAATAGFTQTITGSFGTVNAEFGKAGGEAKKFEKKAVGAVEGTAKSIKDFLHPVKAMRSALGAIVGIGGAVVSVIAAIQVIIEYCSSTFEDGAKAAERFSNTLKFDAKDATGSLEQVRDRLAEVNAELAAKAEAGFFASFLGRSKATIEGEIKALDKMQRSLSNQQRAQKRSTEEAEKQKKLAEAQLKAYEKIADFFEDRSNRHIDERVAQGSFGLPTGVTDPVALLGALLKEVKGAKDATRMLTRGVPR